MLEVEDQEYFLLCLLMCLVDAFVYEKTDGRVLRGEQINDYLIWLPSIFLAISIKIFVKG